MIRVAWRMLTRHPARAAATFAALLYGAAVLTACGVLLESALRYHGVPERYGAAAVVVAATELTTVQGSGQDLSPDSYPLPEGGRVSTSLAPRIAAVPGVRRVVADVTVPVQLSAGTPTGARGHTSAARAAAGHPWSAAALMPFTLQAGAPPASAGDVVLDAAAARAVGAGPGQRVRLILPDGVHTFTVTGIARDPAAPGDAVVFFSDARARALAGHPGTASLLGVIADPGVRAQTLASAIRAILPARPATAQGAFPSVYAGADRGLAGSPAALNGKTLIVAVSATFGGCALLIAIIVISGTVGLSVQQRHRDIALLRAIAATRRQVRRMILIETVMLAVLAGAGGVWAGLASARWLRSQFVSHGFVPGSFALHVSWLPPVVAVGGVMIVAVLAGWIAGWRASRIRPVEALREAAVERRGRLADVVRASLGLVALAGGIALADLATHLTASAAAGTAIGLVADLVIAAALLAPWLTRITVALCAAGLRRIGVSGRLAAANLAASARRLSPVVSALVLAVALGGSLWFLQTSIQHATLQQSRAGLLADQVISASGAGLPAGVAKTVRHVPGVASAAGIVRSTMFDTQGDELTAQGVDGALPATLDLGRTSGSLGSLHGDAVAVDTVTAGDLHLRVGGTFRGWFGDGAPVTLRVAAIYRRGLGFANLTLPAAVLRPHTATGLDSLVLVADSPGADHTSVLAALARAIRGQDPAAGVATRRGYQAAVNAQVAQNTWTIHVSVIVLLVYVVIAALNTLAMAALARRAELAVLRLGGATRRQLLRMVRIEQAVLLGLALIVGGAIAAVTLVPMVKGTTGSTTPYIPPGGWLAVIGGTILLGMAGTLLPIAGVLRIPPIEAIGTQE